jgi:ABC-2 type transport system ATP-binding protein
MLAEARALGPIYAETRFGQTVMVFDGVDRDRLATLGTVSTPTLRPVRRAHATR